MWTAFTDGGVRVANPGLGACAFALYLDGDLHEMRRCFLGESVTNNYAEYQGLLMLLRYLKVRGISGVLIHCDSELMVKQVTGAYKNVSTQLAPLRDEARLLVIQTTAQVKWVPRELNTVADRIVNEVLDEVQNKKGKQ